jgi:glycosyltransferase involved in cell wall biosynthesis
VEHFPIDFMPTISLVLLTYSNPEKLKLTLCSLARQKVNFAYELIIVDNGCLLMTTDIISQFGIGAKYVPLCDNPGFSIGNNKGVAQSEESYF